MYFIRKYIEGLALYHDDTGTSRLLTEIEKEKIEAEFPSLKEEDIVTVYTDTITSITPNLPM